MEDTLWENERQAEGKVCRVLILILMEDTLWEPVVCWLEVCFCSLNPYSNGRYSMGVRNSKLYESFSVLILILMEDTLWAYK